MVSMIKIYGNKRYAFISLTGLLLWFFSFSLQSCFIGERRLNINPITRKDLDEDMAKHVNGVFPKELKKKFIRLENEGFVGGVDPNNDDIRKHFMFIFCHSLNLKSPGALFNVVERDQFVNLFTQLPDAQNLVWNPVPVDRYSAIPPYMVEFRLRNLFTANDPFMPANLGRKAAGHAPDFIYNGIVERIDIDHLFKA